MIYDGALRDSTNFTSDKYLEINSCNIQHSNKIDHCVIRRNGRVDYHVLFVAEGECLCLYGGGEKTMKKGDFVIYPPHESQKYSFMDGIAVTTMWVHFSGVGVEDIFSELGLLGGIFTAPLPSETEHYFRKMISAFAANLPKSKMIARGYLVNTLASLTHSASQSASAYGGAVSKMLEFINLNWQKSIGVTQLAAAVNLSESRAAHLFKEAVGISLHKYITNLKISNSKELLQNTDMSIFEISAMVGYDDPLYFSRLFKAACGISPRNYRKTR